MGTSANLVSKDFDYFKLRDKNTEFGREETVLEKEFGLKRKTLDTSDL